MQLSPPNPYVELKLSELAHLAGVRAGQLLKGGQVGRRDTAYLLIVLASRLDPSTFDMSGPVYRTRADASDLHDAFWSFYQHEVRSLRYWVGQRAFDTAAGLDGQPRSARDVWCCEAAAGDQQLEDALLSLSGSLVAAVGGRESLPGRAPPAPAPDDPRHAIENGRAAHSVAGGSSPFPPVLVAGCPPNQVLG